LEKNSAVQSSIKKSHLLPMCDKDT
jgi:hypothetical protein